MRTQDKKVLHTLAVAEQNKCKCKFPTGTRTVDTEDLDTDDSPASYGSIVTDLCNVCDKIKGNIKFVSNI